MPPPVVLSRGPLSSARMPPLRAGAFVGQRLIPLEPMYILFNLVRPQWLCICLLPVCVPSLEHPLVAFPLRGFAYHALHPPPAVAARRA